MCGNLDDRTAETSELACKNFIDQASAMAEKIQRENAAGKPSPLYEMMDQLFVGGLQTCQRNMESVPPDERSRIMELQVTVFARLAGFLAAHCDASSNSLRNAMEALTVGFDEAEQAGRGFSGR
jgi:hypothetical protein